MIKGIHMRELGNTHPGVSRPNEASSRIVEVDTGLGKKKVILMDTRKAQETPPPDQALASVTSQPTYFQSRSGLFGASKLDQFRALKGV